MTLKLTVKGMTCGGCVRSVTRAIQRIDESAEVRVDLPSGRVEIDGSLNAEQAASAIDEAGFSVESPPRAV